MMQTQRQLLRLSSASFLFPSLPPPPFPHHLCFPGRPNNQYSLCSAHRAWVAQLSEQLTAADSPVQGLIHLPPSISSLLSSNDNPDALQTAASFLITAAFSLFLFQTLRRSANLAKQKRLRSRSTKEEAMESLRKGSRSPLKGKGKGKKPPSPDQTLLGALIAAAFGLLLYKFTTTVESTLNHQPLSPNYSVRQITITIRTIINGLCYLATFVFGFNSLGLFLYSGQLAMNSFVDVRGEARLTSSYSKLPDVDTCKTEDQSSDTTQK